MSLVSLASMICGRLVYIGVLKVSKVSKMLSSLGARPRKTTQLEKRPLGHSTRTMDAAVAPLRFGQSYWDYLPDLVQDNILKLAHKQLLKSVHAELSKTCTCLNCNRRFEAFRDEAFRLKRSNIGPSIGILRMKKGEPETLPNWRNTPL